jgi:hypothetical protein
LTLILSATDHCITNDHGTVKINFTGAGGPLAVVVTAASGYDLGYVWKGQRQADGGAERSPGGYYLSAAIAGEPPGRWFGRGAEALGFTAGQEVERKPYEQVYRQVHPRTGEHLGRKPGGYAKFADHMARLLAAEPHATAERVAELERIAAQATRKAPAYVDVTVSLSKSISVFHASIRENARRARVADDEAAAAYWDAREADYQRIVQAANRAGLEHLERWAGITRTGYHGTRVDGQEPGRYEAAGLVVTSWLQGTSRDGDPQDHVHNQIARMVRTERDGRWRALDTMSVRAQLGAVQATVTAHVEAALAREFGVEWTPRADGIGNEITGITQAQMDAYSTRSQAIKAQTPAAVAAWTAKYGRAPNRRELLHIQQEVTMSSRAGKEEGAIDWDEFARRCDATLGGTLAQIAPAVSRLGGGAADAAAQDPKGPAPREPAPGAARTPDPDAQARTITLALARVQQKQSTWTRADLMREIAAVLPDEARSMEPAAAVELVNSLTDRALAGETEQVICLEAPEWPPLPSYLRRDVDGRSVYTRPGSARYATHVQLSHEEQLTAAAARPGAPALPAEVSARLLGATAAGLEAAARARAHEATQQLASGLRLDQAAALHHALTSDRTVSLIVGPAGSGKTHVLAQAARMWNGPVIGLAPSQAARNVLHTAAQIPAYNTAQFLGHTETGSGALGPMDIQPGTLLMLDEGSMTSLADMAAIVELAARNGCKVIISGDHGQLAAVEGGGGMALLAREQEHTQLATPVRFTSQWERDASLRLRVGQADVLTEYDHHGRITGGPGEQALEDARRAYIAAYLAGRDVLLMARSHDTCQELSQRIRDDLQHLGRVASDGPEVALRNGARASVGDLIITRENDHRLDVANGDTWRVEAINGPAVVMRKLVDCDRVTGDRQYAKATVTYYDHARSAELAYAITGHSAQGRTVHEAHALITGAEDREWAYVTLSRATDGNFAHVVTATPACAHCGDVLGQDQDGKWATEATGTHCDMSPHGRHSRELAAREADPTPGTRAAPELSRYELIQGERSGRSTLPDLHNRAIEREAVGILADVLEREGAELSALEVQRRNLANADHLGRLATIWDAETSSLTTSRYERLLRTQLPADLQDTQLSGTATWLWRSLRAAEAAGLAAEDVLAQAITAKPLTGARDLAAVIDARIREQTAGLIPQPAGPWSTRVPATSNPEQHQYLTALAAAMDERKERLGDFTVAHPPLWAERALGPVPSQPLDRLEWEHRAASIAAWRELYGWDHSTEPIGPEPSSDTPEKRAAWHEAFAALGPVDGVDLRAQPDGRLLLMRRQYQTETAWAPRHVASELRLARLGSQDAEQATIRHTAEAAAARARQDAETASLHDTHAHAAHTLASAYHDLETRLAEADAARAAWAAATEPTRRLALAADTEYRRRHPHAQLDPLRSAEPPTPTAEEQAALIPDSTGITYEPPQWVTDLDDQIRQVSERIAERAVERIPAEDHEWEDLGAAWPDREAAERDAILQPPKPEIPILQQLATQAQQQREAAAEAGG